MPQIRKFEKIDNFSVFQGFDWNTNLSYSDKQGRNQIYDFKDINIIYGRNYSGKTSLSKIIRCFEKKVLPPKYSTPSFLIRCESNSFNQSQINSFNHPIHVYNSDFVKENLRFIHNEDHHIESFSVTLGGENQEILDRIQELKSELGSNILDNETGVHYLIRQKQSEEIAAQTQYTNRKSELENHLNRKASGHADSIRSQSQKFGDQNYNITKLLREIPLVQTSGFSQLTQIQIETYESLITQRDLPEPANITTYALKYSDLICSIESTLKSTVGKVIPPKNS